MFEFAWWWAAIVLPLPILIWWLLPAVQSTDEAALRVPFYHQLQQPVAGTTRRIQLPRLNLLLAGVIWLLLVVAAMRPQWVGEAIEMPVTGRDLMMLVDISGSMSEEDFSYRGQRMNRLQAVKYVAGDFIQQRVGDRIGLILFGEKAYVQTPLTFDRQTTDHFLQEAAVGLAGKSTSIGDAIGLAIKRLRQRDSASRVLVLLTDGANTSGTVKPLDAARLAGEMNIRIYTIGVGSEGGGGSFFGMMLNPSADLDEKSLKAIAAATQGQYFRARDTQELQAIYAEIDRLEPSKSGDEHFRPLDELYIWPLAAALVLSAWLLWRRGRTGE